MNLASRFVYRTFRVPFVFSYKVDSDFATIQRSNLDIITVTGCDPWYVILSLRYDPPINDIPHNDILSETNRDYIVRPPLI